MPTCTHAVAPEVELSATSTILAERLSGAVSDAQDAALALCEHRRLRTLYPELLRLFHGVVRASVPL